MTRKEIISLFPLKARITEEIIERANIYNTRSCIGALTLEEALSKYSITQFSIGWGTKKGALISTAGYFTTDPECNPIQISTEEEIDMMKVLYPEEVTFVVI